jgi:hypothetical protein
MDYPKEGSTSVYDYSDKSIAHAGYTAIAFALVSVFTGALACIQYFLYHRPGTGGFQGHEQLLTARLEMNSACLPRDHAVAYLCLVG